MRNSLGEAGIDKQTITTLVQWAEQYLAMGSVEDPTKLNRKSVESFLRHLINERGASENEQDIALEAVRLLHKIARGEVPEWIDELIEGRKSTSATEVLTYAQMRRLLTHLFDPVDWLMAGFVYGSGLRILECVRLRVRDLDLNNNQVAVRDSYDRVERWVPLAVNIRDQLDPYLEKKRQKHIKDIIKGGGLVKLPPKMGHTHPERRNNWGWQYVFGEDAALNYAPDLEDHPLDHIDPSLFKQTLDQAAVEAFIFRPVNGTTLRNSYADHMRVRNLSPIQVLQLLGKKKPPMDRGNAVQLPIKGLYLPLEPSKDEIKSEQQP
ncbi:MAG: tyrosine-type recombinase/integrase [Pseudomonadota bacterium]